MTTWIINSAVIPTDGWGTYRYEQASVAELASALRGEHISRIGYPDTADAIERLTGVRPDVSRELSVLAPGDVAYVVRLRYRVGAGEKTARKILAGEDFELGRLTRLS